MSLESDRFWGELLLLLLSFPPPTCDEERSIRATQKSSKRRGITKQPNRQEATRTRFIGVANRTNGFKCFLPSSPPSVPNAQRHTQTPMDHNFRQTRSLGGVAFVSIVGGPFPATQPMSLSSSPPSSLDVGKAASSGDVREFEKKFNLTSID